MNRYSWLILILLAAVVFSPDPGRSRMIGAAHDFAHAPAFGAVCVLLLMWLRHWQRSLPWTLVWHYAIAIGIAAGLGLATEVAQYFAGRDSSWIDLRSDVLGALAFAAMFAVFDRRVGSRRLAITVGVLGAAAMIWHTVPLVSTARAYAHRRADFPVILEARDSRPDFFVLPYRADIFHRALPVELQRYPNESALHVGFQGGRWPGIHLLEPIPDWSGYRTLALDVTNPSATPLTLMLRVHDQHHNDEPTDRFNRTFVLSPHTRTTLELPLTEIERAPQTRKLDLRSIEELILFTLPGSKGRELYVSRIWLKNDH